MEGAGVVVAREVRFRVKIGTHDLELTPEEAGELRDALIDAIGEPKRRYLRPKPGPLVRADVETPDAGEAEEAMEGDEKAQRNTGSGRVRIPSARVDTGWKAEVRPADGKRRTNGTLGREGAEWSGNDDALLRQLLEVGRPPQHVAKQLQRSVEAVIERARGMSLPM